MNLTPLAAADPQDVEALLDEAFGGDRRGRTAYRLRQGVTSLPELSFAVWKSGRLVGSLQSWPVVLRGSIADEPLVMVGPVAVAPSVQGLGIGRALMDKLVDTAIAEGADALMMIGDPAYYGRWDFTAEHTAGWRIDGPYEQHRLLARLSRVFPAEGQLLPARHSLDNGYPAVLASA